MTPCAPNFWSARAIVAEILGFWVLFYAWAASELYIG